MTHAVLITDSGFSKDDWTSAIAFGPDAAHSIEVEAIDVPSNSAPEHIFMPPHLRMIRIDFPSFADGRGFTLARLIRLLGFTGRLRAKGHVIAEFDIKPDLWFFDCHFPGNPIMPGCLGLDGLWQLTGFNLGWRGWLGRGYALGVGEVKLTGMVRPDRKMLTYRVNFTKAIQTRRLTMGVADGIVEADGGVIYQVKDMKVALSES